MFSVLVNIDNICHWCRKVSQEKQESRRKHLLLKARNTINFFFLPFSQQETWAKYCFRLHNLPFQTTKNNLKVPSETSLIWRESDVLSLLQKRCTPSRSHALRNGQLFVCSQDTHLRSHLLVGNTCYMWKQNTITQGTLKTQLRRELIDWEGKDCTNVNT